MQAGSVRRRDRRFHSSSKVVTMTLKNSALLALVGVSLATMVLVTWFIGDVRSVGRGLIPPMRLLTSLIFAFAGLSMVAFLLVFHRAQS